MEPKLYASPWASYDHLRGGMDVSQDKGYRRILQFIEYVSEKYADSDDFAPPVIICDGASFKQVLSLRGNDHIGGKINNPTADRPSIRCC